MKCSKWIALSLTPVLLMSINAWAHDPSEHMKNGEKADCSAMHDMDYSKMDMNDPVMQAMMQKCMHQGQGISQDSPHVEPGAGEQPSISAGSDQHNHNH